MTEYPTRLGELDEPFFLERMRSIRESIEERELRIRQRDRISVTNLSEIGAERQAKETRLRLLPAPYQSERVALSGSVDALNKETRAERLSRLKDTAVWEKEKREKLEEYVAVAQIFTGLALTPRPGGEGE